MKIFRKFFLRNKLKKLIPEIHTLSTNLKSLSSDRDPLDLIVVFFETTSSWQDKNQESLIELTSIFRKNKIHDVERRLDSLCLHVERSGRAQFGMNRTVAGETVTASKVFLGNVHGLITKETAYWRSLPKDDDDRKIVSRQAGSYMRSHIDGISDIAKWLEDYAS